MVQTVEKRLFLRDSDGGVTPFDPVGLQTRLIGAFLAAGNQQESYMAEEIVLALEYTLLTTPRPEPVFNINEIDSAIIRLLEASGYPEVAATYRKTGSEQVLRISTSPDTLRRLFASHLGCSAERAERVADIVAQSMAQLQISSATAHLLLEFARHYERNLAEQESARLVPALPGTSGTTLSRDEITALLPAEPRKLMDAGVLKINGITALFPGIRFFFFLNNFARMQQWSSPVTELEVIPQLYAAGSALDAARTTIIAALAPESGSLPCCLAIPDMFDFQEKYFSAAADKVLASELAGALTTGLNCELYNLAFD